MNVCEKILSNERISFEEATGLLKDADLLTLANLANHKRFQLNPDPVVSFVVDRNINYTNVCTSKCKFCAFYKDKDHPDAYVISEEDLKKKIEETIELGGTQILLQGGMHPDLDLDYYLDLISFIKENFKIHIHGFSPPEIAFIAEKSSMSIKAVLEKFITAGLDSIPGGGAEILVDEIRQKLSPNKCSASIWLEVMKTAHESGLKTTATMMFGHIERPEDIVSHLIKIRDLQDQTRGFTAFIPWTFQPLNTRVNVIKATSHYYLKILALSRIVLDNFQNLQASWVTQGEKIAQLSLSFGANDFGSTMIEENVVAAAGVKFRLDMKKIIWLIQQSGNKAVQRNCFYKKLKEFRGQNSKDLEIE